MYANKIEKFTDRVFTKIHLSNAQQNLQLTKKDTILKKSSSQKNSSVGNKNVNSQRNTKKQLGLNKNDIDKLELMNIEFKPENYLNKLIDMYEEEKVGRAEEMLRDQQIQGNSEVSLELWKSSTRKHKNILFSENSDHKKDQIKQETPQIKLRSILKKKINEVNQDNNDIKNTFKELYTHRQKSSEQSSINLSKIRHHRINKKVEKQTQGKKQGKDVERVEKDSIKMGILKNNDLIKQNKKKNGLISNHLQTQNQLLFTSQSINPQINVKSSLNHDNINIANFIKDQRVTNVKSLQEMCYTQIGKRMVITTEKQIHRQLFNSNIYIRSYLMKNIIEYVKELETRSPNSVFILPNERGLHFQPQAKPKQLNTYLEHTKFVHIIRDINHIVQKSIYKQKYKIQSFDFCPYLMITMFVVLIIMLVLAIFIGKRNNYLQNFFMVLVGLIIVVLLVILVGYTVHCYRKQSKFKPVCDIIYEQIDSYFKFINGKMQNNIQWIIGESFFWIQIKINSDNFKVNTHLLKKDKQKKSKKIYFSESK